MAKTIEIKAGESYGMPNYKVYFTEDGGEPQYIDTTRTPAGAQRIADELLQVYVENGHEARIIGGTQPQARATREAPRTITPAQALRQLAAEVELEARGQRVLAECDEVSADDRAALRRAADINEGRARQYLAEARVAAYRHDMPA